MSVEGDGIELSVVLSCYSEESSLQEFHRRLRLALDGLGRSFEIIYVNDGSADDTLARIREIFAADPAVRVVIDLFRNAGQAAAVTAGVVEAQGRVFLFMDSDLQLAPEDLPRLLAEYDKGFDVVGGYRAERRDSRWRTIPSRMANVVMRRVSRSTLRDHGCTYWVMNGRLVRGFALGPLQPIRLPYLIAAAGRCKQVPVQHRERPYGRSGWTFPKLFTYYVDCLVGMSTHLFQWLAGTLLLVGALVALRFVVNVVLPFRLVGEVTNGLLLNVAFLGFLVGAGVSSLIGEYVARCYFLLLRHPSYIVRRVWRRVPGVGDEPGRIVESGEADGRVGR